MRASTEISPNLLHKRQMVRSFLITSEDHRDLLVDSLHVNLWFLRRKDIRLEVGLLLKVSAARLQAGEFRVRLYTPFVAASPNQPVENLHDSLSSEDVLHLLFNDEVRQKHSLSRGGDNRAYSVEFRSGRKFLLLKPTIEWNTADNSFTLAINPNVAQPDELRAMLRDRDVVLVYVRLRYRVDLESSKNIQFDTGALRDAIFYDFRINELRVFDESDTTIYEQMVGISHIYVFVIQPHRYTIQLDAATKMKYIRLLEQDLPGWQHHLPELAKYTEAYLIYYWRENRGEEKKDNSFTFLVSFEAESRSTIRRLLVSLLVTPTATLLLVLPQLLNLEDIVAPLSAIITVSLRALGGIALFVGGSILGGVIWDVIKGAGRRVYRKIKQW